MPHRAEIGPRTSHEEVGTNIDIQSLGVNAYLKWCYPDKLLALLVAVLIDAILPIDPIPVLPTGVQEPVEVQVFDVNAVAS